MIRKTILILQSLCAAFAILFLCTGCARQKTPNKNATVYIDYKNGKHTLFRNGHSFFIQGGSGYTNLKKLHEIGGNTIRVWDTTNIGSILDEAQANNLAVVVGFFMPDSELLTQFYKDSSKVNAQFRAYKSIVEKYKNHPAVLMWCIGNEITFHYLPTYNSFYRCFNNLVDMIHKEDSNHPVTTTLINFPPKAIFILQLRTSIDVLSFNIFGALPTLQRDIKKASWFWKGPYFIAEWGIDAPELDYPHTAWNAYIENTSFKKAQQYLQKYQQNMPLKDPGFLGSLVFYWGQKQEGTSSWFSLFSEDGAPTETVGIMQYLWTGKWPMHPSPQLDYMLVDNKGAQSNLIYKPGAIANAKVVLLKQDSTISLVQWKLYPEDWYKSNNRGIFKRLASSDSSFLKTNNFEATFRMPAKEGPYRLFVNMYNKYGNFATCNTPIYVVK